MTTESGFTAEDLARRMAAPGRTFALLDVREAGEAERGHIFGATVLPRRLLEFRIRTLVRSLATPLRLYDDGDGRAALAAETLRTAGYRDVACLTGGLAAWRAAGQPLATGFNVPSKAFGEKIAAEGVPSVSAEALAAQVEAGSDFVLWDVRPPAEYETGTLPGAVNGAGFELILRAPDVVRSGRPLLLHCAGRTRSLIATRTLQLLGIADVAAVENGTMGWMLSGRALEKGARRALPPANPDTVQAVSRRARACAAEVGVQAISPAQALALVSMPDAAFALFDVRSAAAFAQGHAAEALHVPAGQLVQCTDDHIAVPGAPVLLMDDGDARAEMAGYWLRRMGLPDVRVIEGGPAAFAAAGGSIAQGPQRSRPIGLEMARARVPALKPEALLADPDSVSIIDVGISTDFAAGHLPGARWVPRGSLEARIETVPADRPLLVAAKDERQSLFAAQTLKAHGFAAFVLDGGQSGWRAAGGRIETGYSPEPGFGEDVVLPPYAKDQASMERYLEWEQALHHVPRA